MVREIGEFGKLGVKLQCLTEERERLLVRGIGRFEKMRVREIGIPLYYSFIIIIIIIIIYYYYYLFILTQKLAIARNNVSTSLGCHCQVNV